MKLRREWFEIDNFWLGTDTDTILPKYLLKASAASLSFADVFFVFFFFFIKLMISLCISLSENKDSTVFQNLLLSNLFLISKFAKRVFQFSLNFSKRVSLTFKCFFRFLCLKFTKILRNWELFFVKYCFDLNQSPFSTNMFKKYNTKKLQRWMFCCFEI